MTHDPEAAWPLTETDQGFYPSTPAQLPPSQMVPYTNKHSDSGFSITPRDTGFKPGHKIAALAIVMTLAIPLTVVASQAFGLLGFGVTWASIVMIVGITFGVGFRRN
ncbi:MAG: hypothetical protein FWG08_04740 [Propionibacteriaceae bacterium]|jgi:hypothetical protein|nr:hypothetical protein [Propionibacteriaceae bacterium]